MQKYINNIISSSGKPISGATVLVTLLSTGSTATIYSDNGVTTTTNPLTCDAYGQFSFYADVGRYNFTVTANGVSGYTFTDTILEDYYDALTFSDTGIRGAWVGNTNGYVQLVIQNSNSGSSASSNYIVGNNLTTSNTFFGEFGINSSTFTGTGSLSLPNATYLSSTSGDLVLGTTTANQVRLARGTTDCIVLGPSNDVVVNVTTATPTLTVNGQMVFALTSNTNLRVSVRGTDGITRSGNITLS